MKHDNAVDAIRIHRIAEQMRRRKEGGMSPYVLFLGTGVSLSSGVSNLDDLTSQFLVDFGEVDTEEVGLLSVEDRYRLFYQCMDRMTAIDRYTWLAKAFEGRSPSEGYRYLTKLVEDGYFEVIFSTNWDDFLDVSLEASSILTRNDFRIYINGITNTDIITRDFDTFNYPRIKVLKLYGDLRQGKLLVTPEETSRFPVNLEDCLGNIFKRRDLIMIGYSISDLDVQRSILKFTRENPDNTLIYVNPQKREDHYFRQFKTSYKICNTVSGIDGNFDHFMTMLYQYINVAVSPANVKIKTIAQEPQETKNVQKQQAEDKSSRRLKVFLCHSATDKSRVRDLAQQLRDEGFDPWLDEDKILPGHDWRLETTRAVRGSDVVIVCLSKTSTTKAGYVHKEIKMALDVADEQPEGTVFVIPLKLEECAVPERISRWHWVYYDEEGFDTLVRSLNVRADQLKGAR